MNARTLFKSITSGFNSRIFGRTNDTAPPAKNGPTTSPRRSSTNAILDGLKTFARPEARTPLAPLNKVDSYKAPASHTRASNAQRQAPDPLPPRNTRAERESPALFAPPAQHQQSARTPVEAPGVRASTPQRESGLDRFAERVKAQPRRANDAGRGKENSPPNRASAPVPHSVRTRKGSTGLPNGAFGFQQSASPQIAPKIAPKMAQGPIPTPKQVTQQAALTHAPRSEPQKSPLTETHVATLGMEVINMISKLPQGAQREAATKALENLVPNLRKMSFEDAFKKVSAIKTDIEKLTAAPRQQVPAAHPSKQQVHVSPTAMASSHPTTASQAGNVRPPANQVPVRKQQPNNNSPTRLDITMEAHQVMGEISQLLRGPQSKVAKEVMLEAIGKLHSMPIPAAAAKLKELKSIIATPNVSARNAGLVKFAQQLLNEPSTPKQNPQSLRQETSPQQSRPQQRTEMATSVPPRTTSTVSSKPKPAEYIPFRSEDEFIEDAKKEAREYLPTGSEPDLAGAREKFKIHNARYEAQFVPTSESVNTQRRPASPKPQKPVSAPYRTREEFHRDAEEAAAQSTGTMPNYAEADWKHDLQEAVFSARPSSKPINTQHRPASPRPQNTEPLPFRTREDFHRDEEEAASQSTGTMPDTAEADRKYELYKAAYDEQLRSSRRATR